MKKIKIVICMFCVFCLAMSFVGCNKTDNEESTTEEFVDTNHIETDAQPIIVPADISQDVKELANKLKESINFAGSSIIVDTETTQYDELDIGVKSDGTHFLIIKVDEQWLKMYEKDDKCIIHAKYYPVKVDGSKETSLEEIIGITDAQLPMKLDGQINIEEFASALKNNIDKANVVLMQKTNGSSYYEVSFDANVPDSIQKFQCSIEYEGTNYDFDIIVVDGVNKIQSHGGFPYELFTCQCSLSEKCFIKDEEKFPFIANELSKDKLEKISYVFKVDINGSIISVARKWENENNVYRFENLNEEIPNTTNELSPSMFSTIFNAILAS